MVHEVIQEVIQPQIVHEVIQEVIHEAEMHNFCWEARVLGCTSV